MWSRKQRWARRKKALSAVRCAWCKKPIDRNREPFKTKDIPLSLGGTWRRYFHAPCEMSIDEFLRRHSDHN